MFERGLKEGVFVRFIEDEVEKIVKTKITTEYYEEYVEREMEFMEYRIWRLLNEFVYPRTSVSNGTVWNDVRYTLKKDEYTKSTIITDENYDSHMKLIYVFKRDLSKNTHFLL